MKLVLTFIIGLFVITTCVQAQEVISTDRPTNTYATSVVSKGVVVIETGVLLERTDIGNDERSRYHDFGQTFIRIGTGANLEIQVATSFASFKPTPNADATNGLTPLKLGGKMHLADEKGAWPEISFIGNVTLPWIGEEDFRPEYIAPDFRFIFYNSLSDRFGIGYNLGMAWDGNEARSSFVYSLMFAASVVGDLSAFVEVFGGFPEGSSSNHSFDLGLTYLVSPVFQLDASFGSTFTDPNSYYFNVGAAYMFGSAP
jgi:hypothetical protein